MQTYVKKIWQKTFEKIQSKTSTLKPLYKAFTLGWTHKKIACFKVWMHTHTRTPKCQRIKLESETDGKHTSFTYGDSNRRILYLKQETRKPYLLVIREENFIGHIR